MGNLKAKAFKETHERNTHSEKHQQK